MSGYNPEQEKSQTQQEQTKEATSPLDWLGDPVEEVERVRKTEPPEDMVVTEGDEFAPSASLTKGDDISPEERAQREAEAIINIRKNIDEK